MSKVQSLALQLCDRLRDIPAEPDTPLWHAQARALAACRELLHETHMARVEAMVDEYRTGFDSPFDESNDGKD